MVASTSAISVPRGNGQKWYNRSGSGQLRGKITIFFHDRNLPRMARLLIFVGESSRYSVIYPFMVALNRSRRDRNVLIGRPNFFRSELTQMFRSCPQKNHYLEDG